MNSDVFVGRLLNRIALLEKIVNRQEARLNNMFREATVKSADYSKGLAIVDAHGVETKEVPWMEPAGDIVEWTPLSAGQRVMLVSPGGQVGRAFIIPGGYTDSVQQPHDKGAEKRIKIGGSQVTISASGFLFEAGGTTFSMTAAGFAQTGGMVKHNDHDIGDTHKHTDVIPGPDLTGPPE
jgi:phage baseplate assembly protein gpV